MANDRDVVRIGGLSALVLSALFLVALLVFPGTVAGVWLSILGTLLIVPFAIGAYYFLREAGNKVLIASVLMIVGSVFLVLAYLVSLESAYFLDDRIAAASGAQRELLEASWEYRGEIVDELRFNIGSWLTMSGPLFLFGLFGLRSKRLPRWIAVVGLLTIITGLGWLTPWPFDISWSWRQLPSFVTLAVFMIAIGVVMVRQSTTDDGSQRGP